MATQKDNEIKAMFNKKIQRWDNSAVGAQIGGLLHDSTTLLAHGMEPTKKNIEVVGKWLTALYEIAEEKKLDIITPKPIDLKKAQELGDKWKAGLATEEGSYMARMKEQEIDEANEEISKVVEQEKLNVPF